LISSSPAIPWASSGGETRLYRCAHGPDIEQWRIFRVLAYRTLGATVTPPGAAEFATAVEVETTDPQMPRYVVYARRLNCHKQTIHEAGFRTYKTERPWFRDVDCGAPKDGHERLKSALIACSRTVETVRID
jgi:hypothetical protein